jgi:hypothetical protein
MVILLWWVLLVVWVLYRRTTAGAGSVRAAGAPWWEDVDTAPR